MLFIFRQPNYLYGATSAVLVLLESNRAFASTPNTSAKTQFELLFQSFFFANRAQIANQNVAKRHQNVPERKITILTKNRKKRDPKKNEEKIAQNR